MKAEMVSFETKDKLKLFGMLSEPKPGCKRAVIHVHGWIGNFYENPLIPRISQKLGAEGIAFMSFNNRGTGMVSDIKTTRGGYKRIGGCIERFEDCVPDIEGAIKFLSARGFEEFILQGHSLGCQKIAFYQFREKNEMVKGLVLIAPVDDANASRGILGKHYQKAIELARKMAAERKGEREVPPWMQFYPGLVVRRFLDVSDPNTMQARLFDYSGRLNEIRQLKVPMLAIFGEHDDYEDHPEKKLEILKAMPLCTTGLIQGADHRFQGKESELTDTIVGWIKTL
jgi:pimeloyl-ACP methyl ester carboxylesterase